MPPQGLARSSQHPEAAVWLLRPGFWPPALQASGMCSSHRSTGTKPGFSSSNQLRSDLGSTPTRRCATRFQAPKHVTNMLNMCGMQCPANRFWGKTKLLKSPGRSMPPGRTMA